MNSLKLEDVLNFPSGNLILENDERFWFSKIRDESIALIIDFSYLDIPLKEEKLFEEILLDFEKTIQTSHKKLRVAIAMKPKENYSVEVLKWIKELLKKDESLIKKELKFWVTEYSSHQ